MIEQSYDLTKDNVLSAVSQEEVLGFYLGINAEELVNRVRSRKKFLSPFRKESNPSCDIRVFRDKFYFNDWGAGLHLDCFDIVQHAFGCGFTEALMIINKDFKLGLGSGEIPSPLIGTRRWDDTSRIAELEHRTPLVQIRDQPYTKVDLTYWGKFGLDEQDLKRNKVYSAKTVFADDEPKFFYSFRQPIFGYLNPSGTMRIYRPFAHIKWYGNSTLDDVQGYDQLQGRPKLIITKSKKDAMVIDKLGIDSFAPHSECSGLPDRVISEIRQRYRPEDVRILFDNDEAGRTYSARLSAALQYKSVEIPQRCGAKDIAQFRAEQGEVATRRLLTNLTQAA
jgi:5S rRNA maturation endonuclease (ribonuclease M5)